MEAGEKQMTSDYWKSFWLSHAKNNQNSESQTQVLRTLNKRPVSQGTFDAIIDSIITLLNPEQGNKLLDLCCGNGVITHELIDKFDTVTAVDLSEDFITQLLSVTTTNVTAFSADARNVDFPDHCFDRILIYAGIQYFTDIETINLFMRLKRWIRAGGLVVIGDIPDATRKWNFFNTPERESAYFDALRVSKPIVGHWFEPSWLEKLSHHVGFTSAKSHLQPQTHPYRHYRFDLVLT
jgi:ubiquinone/menaquinone biosynthesis C-methylase UbiE